MDSYSITIKWVDPSGHGIITTFIYKAANENSASDKANKGFKNHTRKLYGGDSDFEIRSVDIEKIHSGFFSERAWKNVK